MDDSFEDSFEELFDEYLSEEDLTAEITAQEKLGQRNAEFFREVTAYSKSFKNYF